MRLHSSAGQGTFFIDKRLVLVESIREIDFILYTESLSAQGCTINPQPAQLYIKLVPVGSIKTMVVSV